MLYYTPSPTINTQGCVWKRRSTGFSGWTSCHRDTLVRAFGGTKQSGHGREQGAEAVREFTQAKNVNLNLG